MFFKKKVFKFLKKKKVKQIMTSDYQKAYNKLNYMLNSIKITRQNHQLSEALMSRLKIQEDTLRNVKVMCFKDIVFK